MSDFYNDPGRLGLTTIGSAEKGYGYEWDTFAVYRHNDTGDLYYLAEAGCSCSYFGEDVRSLADLTAANSVQDIHDALDEWDDGANAADVVELHAELAFI